MFGFRQKTGVWDFCPKLLGNDMWQVHMEGNFGFIHEKIEIKILILFILRRLPEPVPFYILTELALCDDGISYFDLTECVAELVKTEHLRLDGGMYSLTEKGARNGEITENNLPFSVRLKAETNVSIIRIAQNRNSMIKTSHSVDPNGGCVVDLSLSDGISNVVSMELLAMNEKQAASLEKGFRRNAERIYKALIEMILN